MAVSGQLFLVYLGMELRLYREDLAVSGQLDIDSRALRDDYTERIWRYQDNESSLQTTWIVDYTERIWRYQDNQTALPGDTTQDYTERIWRYQDNVQTKLEYTCCDYTERIWRYQDNDAVEHFKNVDDYTERIWRYQDNPTAITTTSAQRLYREDLAVSGQLLF